MFPRVIVLVGQRGSGKDTVAAALMRAGAYHRLPLADPLITLATTLWPDGFPRDALQQLGHACATIDAAVLAQRAVRWIATADPTLRWVIPDVRRPAEVATLRAAFGLQQVAVWWVWAPATVRQARLAQRIRSDGLRETDTSAQDATETFVDFSLAACDAIWDNHRSVPDPVTTWATWLRAHPNAWRRGIPRYHDSRPSAAPASSVQASMLIP